MVVERLKITSTETSISALLATIGLNSTYMQERDARNKKLKEMRKKKQE